MENKALFGAALGLVDPWYVATVSLDIEKRQLELGIDFQRGGTFACSECGAAGCKAYDTEERRWRHLDFFQYRASVMPYSNREWEELSIFLDLIVPKLRHHPRRTSVGGILQAIDMDSYRVEKKAAMKIALADANAEIGAVPTQAGGHRPEPEIDRLSNILRSFNEHFGTLFTNSDRVAKRIREDVGPKVAADAAYQNAKENTPHTARTAHDQALGKVMQVFLKDETRLYKQFVENESFRRFVGDMVYALTRPT